MEQKMKELTQKLAACIRACNHCHEACLGEDDVKSMVECIRLDKDCAEVCSMALNRVYKNSRFIRQALRFCKDVCKACKEECEKYHMMDHCQQCAEACRACEMACEEFIEIHHAENCKCDPCECGEECDC